METIIKIFAFIGAVVIIVYLIYRAWNYFQYVTEQNRLNMMRPPLTYMQESGIKCPDYWVYQGVDGSNNYRCKNTYNLSVASNSTLDYCKDINCYDTTSNEIVFSALQDGKDWSTMTDDEKKQFLNDKGSASASRCDWIKCCGQSMGATVNSDAVWLGVTDLCNAPAPSLS